MTKLTQHTHNRRSAILLISCPDRKGLVASITEFIFKNNGNIIHLDQHVDLQQEVFFMRVEWDLDQFRIPPDQLAAEFQAIAERFTMAWDLHFSDFVPRMALFVSDKTHCLYDILARYQSGEWNITIPVIISNHSIAEPIARTFNIDYHCLPITKDNKHAQEQHQLRLLAEYRIDFIVLARYMQILSAEFVAHYPHSIINIHHSFLPAFVGAKPYHSAYNRGVKIIGATSHYVTEELDNGPIIEQDVVRISHKDSVQDLVRKGKDLERLVLSRAIWYHLRHKILVYNNKTVIFD